MRGVEQIPWLYDACCALSERTGLRRWREWLVRGATGRVLDVGCGTGRNLPLYDDVRRAVALDPDRRLLARARRRGPGARFVIGCAEALPFPDGTFETVVSGLVFCSVADPHRGLREVRRVLAPHGSLRMMEHVRAGGLTGRLQDLIQPAWTKLVGGCHPNRETEANVEAAGFTILPDGRRVKGSMRRFVAKRGQVVVRPDPETSPSVTP